MMIDKYKWYNYVFEDNSYHITIARDDNHAIDKSNEFNKTCIKIYESLHPNKIIYERENRVFNREGQPQETKQEEGAGPQEGISLQQAKRKWDDSPAGS